ncbi:MAG: hypothetical protein J6Y48_06735 [Clostridia bacterium]|nr:hypothetical protein [Clostridia bacterium]
MDQLGFLSGVFKENGKIIMNLIQGWNYFLSHEVVVGITMESNAARGPVSNAELLYLHDQGVPSRNIPPRPVLRPAINKPETRKQIETLMRDAAVAALVTGNRDLCEKYFNKAGMVAQNACKNYIKEGTNLAPNSPVTIAIKGSSKPLIDTASMMNSITYAVRKK